MHLTRLRAAIEMLLATVAVKLDPHLLSGTGLFALSARLADAPDVRAAMDLTSAALDAFLLPPLLWFIAMAAIYWIASEASPWQATIGKRALGLRVACVDGRRATLLRTAARHASGALSWLSLNLGHALAAWTRDKRALHDLLTGTNVFTTDDAAAAMPRWALAWLWLIAIAMTLANVYVALQLAGLMRAALDHALFGV